MSQAVLILVLMFMGNPAGVKMMPTMFPSLEDCLIVKQDTIDIVQKQTNEDPRYGESYIVKAACVALPVDNSDWT